MSASTILSIAAVAAPSTGRASPAAADEFEAMLTAAAEGAPPLSPPASQISAAPSDAADLEPPTDPSDVDAYGSQPADPAVSPVWFQMAPVDRVPVIPAVSVASTASGAQPEPTSAAASSEGAMADGSFDLLKTPVGAARGGAAMQPSAPSGNAVADIEAVVDTLPSLLPVLPPSVETSIPASNPPAVASADGPRLTDPGATPTLVSAAMPLRQSDLKAVANPALETAPDLDRDPAMPRVEAGRAANVAAIAPTAGQAGLAASSTLAVAALNSLRQVPGAEALQQARISQRRTAASVAPPPPSGPMPLPTTAPESLATSAFVSASSSAPIAGEPIRNAASVPTQAMAGTTQAAETMASAPAIETDTIAVPAASSPDAVIDPATPAKPIEPVLTDIASTIDTAPEPSSPGATASSPVTSTSVAAAQGGLLFSGLSRATIETTANLAAQITSRLSGRSTRMELGLTPEGLGRVDVTLDIDEDGQLSARLAFDNPLAATELRGRADELRRQLEDAGFTLARDALDFSSRDNPSGGERRQQRTSAYADRHAANDDMIDNASTAWMPSHNRLTPQGVDVKV